MRPDRRESDWGRGEAAEAISTKWDEASEKEQKLARISGQRWICPAGGAPSTHMYWYLFYHGVLVGREVPVRIKWTSLLDSFCLILTSKLLTHSASRCTRIDAARYGGAVLVQDSRWVSIHTYIPGVFPLPPTLMPEILNTRLKANNGGHGQGPGIEEEKQK